MSKSPSKKSTKPVAVKVIKRTRKTNALHEKLIKLFTRPNGATLTDTVEAGFKYPAVAALRIAERRGYKTNVVKKAGELTRYTARKA
jgi:hypothetical protein